MKEETNIYFEERKRASVFNEKLTSCEKASELLDMSTSNLSSIELGKHKAVPPDVVARMADLYNAPRLTNYYCLNECPLGERKRRMISCEIEPIEKIAIHIVGSLRASSIEKLLDHVIAVAQDGEITEDELNACEEIEEYFDRFCKTYSEFKIRLEMARKDKAA